MDFLASNLGAVLSVLGKLIKLYIIYKTVTKALELKDQFNNWMTTTT